MSGSAFILGGSETHRLMLPPRADLTARTNAMRYEMCGIPATRAATVIALAVGLPYGILAVIPLFFVSTNNSSTSVGPGGATTVASHMDLTALAAPRVAWFFLMAMTWIVVTVVCGVYNIVASRVGGIAVELRELDGPNT